MMQLRLGVVLVISALSLAGCGRFALNNHSLDYKKAQALEPLKFPENATVRPFTPLYPAPTVDALAIEHAPNFVNKTGNRYALPRPEAMQSSGNPAASTTTTLGRPQLVMDGNKNPLLKVDGPTAAAWQYTFATLSSLNYKVVSQADNGYEATIKVGDQNYLLKLSAVGTSNTVALFKLDTTFADQATATEVLTQIYQNWPA
ncbi:lipoprotein-34 precursor (NlpB) [Acinetobacter sp. VNH17]|uniref:Lipoprotein-34 (NlpB) n=1 Tax=Acinetobacter thutiue TaxID=2998078 RepID=A0ABT7WR57_9GAMM|nr:lipoprotein-34 precursor (NlpB) [Acinetobacter thutiue]MCY6413043.1 lipoprotein-34 precursor (NlpB) [Acinetobacter thutiue]MDN0015151.1 lipoprotein-34 precursor (NlpB) [Acinetobacter thutiue]